MKTKAIIRIIIFSTLILGLLGILAAGFAVGTFVNNISWYQSASITDGNVESVGSVSASEIQELEIEWVSGSITLQTADTDTISFSETSGLDSKYQMVWKQSGSKLSIQYQKPHTFLGFSFGFDTKLSKDLVITIPSDWQGRELSIDSVSASIDISGLAAQRFSLTNVSGRCKLDNCIATDVEIETVSGRIDYSGSLFTLNLESVSADCVLKLASGARDINMSAVSGDLTLYLPEDQGFTAELEGISGKITTDFPTTSSDGKYRYGDESCHIESECVSGSMNIYQTTGITEE